MYRKPGARERDDVKTFKSNIALGYILTDNDLNILSFLNNVFLETHLTVTYERKFTILLTKKLIFKQYFKLYPLLQTS